MTGYPVADELTPKEREHVDRVKAELQHREHMRCLRGIDERLAALNVTLVTMDRSASWRARPWHVRTWEWLRGIRSGW